MGQLPAQTHITVFSHELFLYVFCAVEGVAATLGRYQHNRALVFFDVHSEWLEWTCTFLISLHLLPDILAGYKLSTYPKQEMCIYFRCLMPVVVGGSVFFFFYSSVFPPPHIENKVAVKPDNFRVIVCASVRPSSFLRTSLCLANKAFRPLNSSLRKQISKNG